MKLSWLLVLTVFGLLLTPSLPAQSTAGNTANPPANFKKVSALVRLPDWLPGLGTLYVDPASLPVTEAIAALLGHRSMGDDPHLRPHR